VRGAPSSLQPALWHCHGRRSRRQVVLTFSPRRAIGFAGVELAQIVRIGLNHVLPVCPFPTPKHLQSASSDSRPGKLKGRVR